MSVGVASYALEVLGPFRLLAPDGRRIDIASKKGQALIAMLAVAGGGERTRSWLQSHLWGSREQDQAQASLRSALSSLRAAVNIAARPLLHSDHTRVWLDLTQVRVDAREIEAMGRLGGEFLEGLDIPGEEAFEDWLRDERARTVTLLSRAAIRGSEAVEQTLSPTVAASTSVQFADLPALAVLPFMNLTGDPGQDFLAEGIAEDLIDRLSRLRWLPIIARSSSYSIRAQGLDSKAVGAMLGARYLLEGRVRKHGSALVLAAFLADCEKGQVVWSNKITLEDSDDPDALAALLAGLTSSLGAKIDQEEQSRALRKPQSDLNVRELIWRGRWHFNRFTREDSELARSCFTRALQLEPNSPEAIIQNTWATVWDVWARRAPQSEVRIVRQMAQQAIIADYDDARGHMLAGIGEIWLRQPLRAKALLRRAIELNPSLVMAHAQLGSALMLSGEPEQAIEVLNTAIRLSPNDHDLFFILGELAMSYLLVGNLDEALTRAEHSISRRGAYWLPHVVKVNALARLGRRGEAANALADLMSAKTGFSPKFVAWQPFVDPRTTKFLQEGLNLAAN